MRPYHHLEGETQIRSSFQMLVCYSIWKSGVKYTHTCSSLVLHNCNTSGCAQLSQLVLFTTLGVAALSFLHSSLDSLPSGLEPLSPRWCQGHTERRGQQGISFIFPLYSLVIIVLGWTLQKQLGCVNTHTHRRGGNLFPRCHLGMPFTLVIFL